MLCTVNTTLVKAPALIAVCALAACAPHAAGCPPVLAAASVPIAGNPALISPSNGASGVPTSGVRVELSFVLPSTGLHVTPQGTGASLAGGPFTPAPDAGSTASIPVTAVVSALPPLAAHTTYTIFLEPPPPNAPLIVTCQWGVANSIRRATADAVVTAISIGSFTTQ